MFDWQGLIDLEIQAEKEKIQKYKNSIMTTIKLEKEIEPKIEGGEKIWYMLYVNGSCKKAFNQDQESEAKIAYQSYVEFYEKHREPLKVTEILQETTL